jgi:hypothetical protein
MAILTDEQKAFLERHGIPISKVFDASGMSKRQRERAMRQLDIEVAYGVSPCRSAGHTLRSRSGHCVQCGTHHLAFQRRYNEGGEVYVAYSKTTNLVKVGTAQDANDRLHKLNYFQYGGCGDWEILATKRCERAARVELNTQRALYKYRTTVQYEKQGVSVTCQELFRCTATHAIATLENSIREAVANRAT